MTRSSQVARTNTWMWVVSVDAKHRVPKLKQLGQHRLLCHRMHQQPGRQFKTRACQIARAALLNDEGVQRTENITQPAGWLLGFNDVTHNKDDLDVGVDRIPTGRCNVGTPQSPEDWRSESLMPQPSKIQVFKSC